MPAAKRAWNSMKYNVISYALTLHRVKKLFALIERNNQIVLRVQDHNFRAHFSQTKD